MQFFRKDPTIISTLQNEGKEVGVKIKNADFTQVLTMLYLTIKQVAVMLNVDHRFIVNKIIALDKKINKHEKTIAKKERYSKN